MLHSHRQWTSTCVRRLPSLATSIVCWLTTALPMGCNHVPLADLEQSFQGKVTSTIGQTRAVKLDVLWVIDNSSSMGQEQVALANTFETFVDRVFELDVDLRVAVTTTADECDQGLFNTTPSTDFFYFADKRITTLCYEDTDCVGVLPGDPGPWQCDGQKAPEKAQNPDGSVNTNCVATCESDVGCASRFGPDYYCTDLNRCGLRPRTEGCATTVGPVVDGEAVIDDFSCLASVGLNAGGCYSREMGLAAGLHALDVQGPHPEQARQFLRPEAYLVVIFVSDEDDCSLAAGVEPWTPSNEGVCAYDPKLSDRLEPVHKLVNRYKSLKKDPNSVIVAAIGGDATESGAAKSERRDAFLGAIDHHLNGGYLPYICNSETGTAMWGRRYQAFTDGFGARGVFANVCGEGGIDAALAGIADSIYKALGHACLARATRDGETVRVYLETAGGRELLTEGEDADYSFLVNAGGCELEGRNAIEFHRELTSEESFVIEYAFALAPSP